MDIDDMLQMENESALRLEDIMREHNCPICNEIMKEKESRQYGKYCHCDKCNKNFSIINKY